MSKIYVVATDRALSGWGDAEGKISKYIIECDSWSEANIVEQNMHHRSEMKHVNVHTKMPYYSPNKYHVKVVDKEEAGRFFIPHAFAPGIHS